MLPGEGNPRRTCAGAVLLAILLPVVGCRGAGEASWDPMALMAAAFGGTAQIQTERAWDRWAVDHLQDGDIAFVLGDGYFLLGLVNFSELSTELTQSSFSHVALIAREDGQVVVYEMVMDGARRIPFGQFMGDSVRTVAVKRPRPEYQGHVEAALAFCRRLCATRGKFDRDFRLANDRLYCSEMVELAYRSAGLPLSDPVPINQLPGYGHVGDGTKRLLTSLTRIRLDEPVYLPGNERFGIWSCPYLDLLLEPTAASSPPGQQIAARPSRPGSLAR